MNVPRIESENEDTLRKTTNTRPQGMSGWLSAPKEIVDAKELNKQIMQAQITQRALPKLAGYLEVQPSITALHRTRLVDWLIGVHESQSWNHECIHRAIKILDAYCSVNVISKDEYQLIGAASLFIATKFIQLSVPSSGLLARVTNYKYTSQQVEEKERHISGQLMLACNEMTSYTWFSLYLHLLKRIRIDTRTKYLCLFFLDITLLEAKFLRYRPSLLAGAALFLGHKIFSKGWSIPEKIMSAGEFRQSTANKVANEIANTMISLKSSNEESNLLSIYSSLKYKGVANIQFNNSG